MSNNKFEIDFSFFKLNILITIFLMVLKLAGKINISDWIVFLPVLISIGWFFLIVFIIGLITLYFINKETNNNDEDDNSSEANSET